MPGNNVRFASDIPTPPSSNASHSSSPRPEADRTQSRASSPLADELRAHTDAFFDRMSAAVDSTMHDAALYARAFGAGISFAANGVSRKAIEVGTQLKDLLSQLRTGVGNLIGTVVGALGGATSAILGAGASLLAASVGGVSEFVGVVKDLFASASSMFTGNGRSARSGAPSPQAPPSPAPSELAPQFG